jgi:signal transduction histidine kinase
LIGNAIKFTKKGEIKVKVTKIENDYLPGADEIN